MDNEKFVYNYSAKDNAQINAIRQKYLPKEESKLDELKKLDYKVQTSGYTESLCVGIISALIFGLGMCLSMQVIGSGIALKILGIAVGIVGMAGMALAYPIYKKVYEKTKEKYTPRILELTEELTNGNA